MAERRIILAAVAGAHGVGGEVRLKLFAGSVEALKAHKQVQVGDRTLALAAVKGGEGAPIARFTGIADRNAAEALRGALVSVERSALPLLAEGEYYHADLIGLACIGPEGEVLGRVAAVENFGAGDLLEIETPDGRRQLVPFREGIADWRGNAIIVDPAFLA